MPRKKDLKRLVRARMEKTGEAYTAARRNVIERETAPQPGGVVERDLAALAGASEEAVRAKTGRGWSEWVAALDAVDALALGHRRIVLHLEGLGVPGWWAQMVTVGYERIRGLREVGQRLDGTYEASKSKTFPVPVTRLFRAFAEEEVRRRWLDVEWEVRTVVPGESMRVTLPDASRVAVFFAGKGKAKSVVAVQHGPLAGREEVAERKAWWAQRLAVLAELLALPEE
jgi:hypothetical protein